jgi:hypothetical protein
MGGWTVVVWAAVTPDLEQAVIADLHEVVLAVKALQDTGDVHLLVVGTPASDSAMATLRSALPEPADASDPPDPDAPPERVMLIGEAQDGAALRAVLLGCSEWNDVSRQRILVLWGHGFLGVRGATASAVPAADEVVLAFAGTDGPRRPEIIGYDACRMATAPTVLTLAQDLPTAVFIGSMIPEPASGWPYSEVLRVLATDTVPESVAAAIVQAYAGSVDVADWCLLALRLTDIGGTGGPLDIALEALLGVAAPKPADFFAAASGADTLDDTDLVDLGALMRRLTDRSAYGTGRDSLHEAATGVRDTIRNATIARRASGNLAGRDGLSIQLLLPPLPSPPAPPSPSVPDESAPVPVGGRDLAPDLAPGTPAWGHYLEEGLFHRGKAAGPSG